MAFRWSVPPPPPELAPGARLGAYQLVSRLGQGGMAEVFLGREVASGQEVALKVLRLGDEQEQERFVREGELAGRLGHPYVVRVLGAGATPRLQFLALELVRGAQSLEEAWEGRPLLRRLRWLHQAASAVGYAHSQGIVHRDLKPDNVLVDEQGVARVSDFGVALALDLERLTMTGVVVGSPLYMAPEQLASEAISPATDVWALGTLLYLALTESLPYQEASTWLELARRMQAGPPPPPSARVERRLPEPLERLCLEALSREPSERPPHGAAFAERLVACLNEARSESARVARPAAGPLQAGDRLGPCRLEQLLGRGGMGSVFRAHHQRLDRAVAIKLVAAPKGGAAPAHFLERFRREARAAAQVNHPHVAKILDLAAEPRPYLIQELVEGRSLEQRFAAEGALDPEEVRRIGVQIAQGLEAIHAAGLVHRDIKPDNVLADREGEHKIVDFGVVAFEDADPASAGRFTGEGKLTQQGAMIGTPLFMAPEQIEVRERLTSAADVFALGATLYYLLTGLAPHQRREEGRNLLNLLVRRRDEAAQDVRALREDVPADLAELLADLLAPEPGERPSAEDAVIRLLASRGSASGPQGEQRLPLPALAGLAVGGVVILGLALVALGGGGAEPEVAAASPPPTDTPLAVSPSPAATPEPSATPAPPPVERATPPLSTTPTPRVATSPTPTPAEPPPAVITPPEGTPLEPQPTPPPRPEATPTATPPPQATPTPKEEPEPPPPPKDDAAQVKRIEWRNDDELLWEWRPGQAPGFFSRTKRGAWSATQEGLLLDGGRGRELLFFAPDLPTFRLEVEFRLVRWRQQGARLGLVAYGDAKDADRYQFNLCKASNDQARVTTYVGPAQWIREGEGLEVRRKPGGRLRLSLTCDATGLTFQVGLGKNKPRVRVPRLARRRGYLGISVRRAEATVQAVRVFGVRLGSLDAARLASPRPVGHRPRVVCMAASYDEFTARRKQDPLGLGLCLRRIRRGSGFFSAVEFRDELLEANQPPRDMRKRSEKTWGAAFKEARRFWELGEGLDPLGEQMQPGGRYLIHVGSRISARTLAKLSRAHPAQFAKATLVSSDLKLLAAGKKLFPADQRVLYHLPRSPSGGAELLAELPTKALGWAQRKGVLANLEDLNRWRVAAAQRAGWEVYALAPDWSPDDLAAAAAWCLDGVVTLGTPGPAEQAATWRRWGIQPAEGEAARRALAPRLVGWSAPASSD